MRYPAYAKSKPTVISSHEGSRASSLGPSDSASQQSRFDPTTQQSVDHLLSLVEAPDTKPDFLPVTVLWYHGDCGKDNTYGPILQASNMSRPKMQLAIRRSNGTVLSPQEYQNIRELADLLVRRLFDKFGKDPRLARLESVTRKNFKQFYYTEYRAALLELEAQHTILRLCAQHWKAEVMLGQSFTRRNDAIRKAARAHSAAPTSDEMDLQPPEPLPAVPRAWDVAPTNASKRALEFSPGPKSPSASHTQKRAKDKTTISGQKTSSSLVPSCEFFSVISETAD